MEETLSDLKKLDQFENLAISQMDKHAKYYFCAGASTSSIPRDNEEALAKYKIQPRVLRDVSNGDLSCEILKTNLPCPIGIAPTGFHFFAHKDAEIATAKAAAEEQCIYIMSSVSSTRVEDVWSHLQHLPTPPVLWMQLYIVKERSIVIDLLKRVEACGFSAIVVTVDAPISGQWKTSIPDGFVERTKDRYLNFPVPLHTIQDATLTFEDLKWLKNQTNLPVIVKGILNGDDAAEAVRCGASAIYVSNHGARQIHKVVPSIEVLEEVIEAVEGFGVDVYFDGGIRSGNDIFIAMALGAKAVFVGRPAIWGLTLEGEEGVRRILRILKDEFLSTMKLAGIKSIKDLNKTLVRKIS